MKKAVLSASLSFNIGPVAQEQLGIPQWFSSMENQIKTPKRTYNDHCALMCETIFKGTLCHTVLILSTFRVFAVIGPAVCNLIGSITNK